MKKLIITSLAVIMLFGCASPTRFSDQPMAQYDKDTRYVIEDAQDGFFITVAYSRYQFIPESDAVATSCRSQLTALAWEHADKMKKKIKPINEQRIQLSMGRNGLSGITSCQARTKAEWE